MPYSSFDLPTVLDRFGLRLDDASDLYSAVPERAPSSLLREWLAYHIPLALAVSTEAARATWLTAPILSEIRQASNGAISIFPGVRFDVDAERGLVGECDFLLSRSPEQRVIRAPVLALVEAKRDDISAGLGQVAAEMMAARVFNQRADHPIPTLYGVVTTGSNWQFLQLHEALLSIDRAEYHVSQLPKILGILLHTALGSRST